MANDREWQRRSDLWVKATHESREQKEKRFAKQKNSKSETTNSELPPQKK